MTTEAEVCEIIKHAAENAGMTYIKIPDPSSGFATTSIRPFDSMAVRKHGDGSRTCLFIEAKCLKELKAFSFKKVESHQDFFLKEFGSTTGSEAYVILGVRVGRGNNRAYIFDWKSVGCLYPDFSIYAKYLDLLPFNEIHKESFEFKNIIGIEDLKKVGIEF